MGNRLLRRLAAVALGLGTLAAVEGGLRLAGVAADPVWTPTRVAWVVKNGALQQALMMPPTRRYVRTADGYETAPAHRSTMRYETFPATGERAFAIGESAVVGQAPSGRIPLPRPADEEAAYRAPAVPNTTSLPGGPGMLAASDAFPARIEAATGRRVVNMGRVAQDSDGHVASVKEALALGASGLLLYFGNNESLFLPQLLTTEAIPSVTRDRLRELRLYRVLFGFRPGQDAAPPPTELALDRARFEGELPGRAVERLWAQAGHVLLDADGLADDTLAEAVNARFRTNFTKMAELAAEAQVPLWFIACPPALHYPPFANAHAPDAPDPDGADRLVASATARFRAGEVAQARAEAHAAVEADPGSAAAWYLLAVTSDADGAASEAVDAAQRAAALDPSHKRSTPAFTRIAREVCATRGCATYDLHAELVAAARERGLYAVYEPWFGDLEHPLPAGHAMLAERFVAMMAASTPHPAVPAAAPRDPPP